MHKPQAGPWWLVNPTSRATQWRLLLLVFAFGLTLVLMQQARQPDRWQWLWGSGIRRPAVAQRPGAADATQGLPLGVFRSPASPAFGSASASRRLLAGIDPEALAAIEDDTVFRSAERNAWFNMFGVLGASDPQQLEQASTGIVGFVQLLEQPKQYRGQLVTVRGQVRRVLFRPAPQNDIGIGGYHQVVLRPADGPNSPLIVYCLELPDGFPSGEGIREDVAVTGLFFKNWAFATGDAIRSSPTLLARTLDWQRPPAAAVQRVQGSHLVILVVATAAASLLIAAWIVRRANRLTLAHQRWPADAARPAAGQLGADQVASGLQRLAESSPGGTESGGTRSV